MSHGDLYEEAERGIDELFNDNSVPQETTKSSLEALVTHIRIKLATLEAINAAILNQREIR